MTCYKPLEARRTEYGRVKILNRVYGNPTMKSGRRQFLNSLSDNYLILPCGKCHGCRLEYSKQWALRCVHEAMHADDSMFLTLTYREDEVPYVGHDAKMTLCKRDFQLFMKSLRERINKPIRFFAAGEYSPEKYRPHYHACIFGYKFPKLKVHKRGFNGQYNIFRSDLLEDIWKKGHSTIGEVNFQSSAYTARYIMKKVNGDLAKDHYEHRQPEFTLMSRGRQENDNCGLGYKWYKDFAYSKQIGYDEPQDFVTFKSYKGNVAKTKQPRYYDKLLERWDKKTYDKLVENRRSKAKTPDVDRLFDAEFKQTQRLGKLIRNTHDELYS